MTILATGIYVMVLAFEASPPGVPVADEPAARRSADIEALNPLGGLVGDWRGVGQVQRNSARDAWKESAQWSWKLDATSAALEWRSEGGKHLKSGLMRPGPKPGTFGFEATFPDGARQRFSGEFNDRKQLILTAEGESTRGTRRISLTPLHESRFLVLFEAQDAPGRYRRLGEVGFTREGVKFAAGDSAPVCIVTGGRGTIPVKYQGATYWVCCSGCKALFEENPEAILAEFKKSQAKQPEP